MSTKHPIPTYKTKERVRNPIPDEVDVAIVGTGMGGLTAGAYLARSGLRVACFDPHYVAGGCATQFARGSRNNRFLFDVGIHYLGDCGPKEIIPRILEGAGAEVEFQPLDPEGFDVFLLPDLTFPVPANHELYRQRLLEYFPEEKKGIDRFMRLLWELRNISSSFLRNHGKLSLGIIMRLLFQGRKILAHRNSTIGEFLDTCTKNPKLRAILLGQHGDYAVPPGEASAVFHGGLCNHFLGGAYYPKGGGQVITNQLAEVIEQAGGSIHLRCPVAEIIVEHGRAVGVRTEPRQGEEGYEVRAKAVLSNADLRHTILDLIAAEHLPSPWRNRMQRVQMAGALFITFLGVKADLPALGMNAANYWQFDSYDFDEMYRRQRESDSIQPWCSYMTCASLKDPHTYHAPDGIHNLELITLVPGDPKRWGFENGDIKSWDYKRNDLYQETKQAIEEDQIERLERYFPGTRETIVFRESATPLSQTRYTRASGGTGYGIASTAKQYMNDRPDFRGPFSGLYFCGDSTRAGPGILGAMLSGYESAFCVAEDLNRSLPAIFADL